jgi:hypothetical protein
MVNNSTYINETNNYLSKDPPHMAIEIHVDRHKNMTGLNKFISFTAIYLIKDC